MTDKIRVLAEYVLRLYFESLIKDSLNSAVAYATFARDIEDIKSGIYWEQEYIKK